MVFLHDCGIVVRLVRGDRNQRRIGQAGPDIGIAESVFTEDIVDVTAFFLDVANEA